MSIGTPLVGTKDEQSAASTTSTPGHPVGMAAGDLELLWGFSGNSNNTTFTTPAGFTQVMQAGGSASTAVPNFYLAYKFADGTESGTLSCTHGSVPTSMMLMSVSGVDRVNPLDIAAVLLDSVTASTTFTFPAQTVLTDGAMAVYGVSGNSTTITATPATGFTEAFDRVAPSTRSHEVAWKANLPIGSTGSISAAPGWSGASKPLGVLIILRPAYKFELLTPTPRYY